MPLSRGRQVLPPSKMGLIGLAQEFLGPDRERPVCSQKAVETLWGHCETSPRVLGSKRNASRFAVELKDHLVYTSAPCTRTCHWDFARHGAILVERPDTSIDVFSMFSKPQQKLQAANFKSIDQPSASTLNTRTSIVQSRSNCSQGLVSDLSSCQGPRAKTAHSPTFPSAAEV